MSMNNTDWNEERLQRLVQDQVQESVALEYKSSKALTRGERDVKELSKDVSAFANSAGGTIIYGIVEKGHTPERVDDGIDPSMITREWIEQVLNSNIQRRIDGIRITQVPLTITSPGRVAYVIEVPQSLRAPHQANDKRFYKRFNFQSIPMEEYEIRDVARRREAPALSVQLLPLEPHEGGIRFRALGMSPVLVALSNESEVPCEHAVIDLLVDRRLQLYDLGPLKLAHKSEFEVDGQAVLFDVYRLFWSAKNGLPVFRGCRVAVSRTAFAIDGEKTGTGTFAVRWKVIAPGAEASEGTVTVTMAARGGGVLMEPDTDGVGTGSVSLPVPAEHE